MARSKSSKNWLKEHFDDIYVKKAQQEGYRSRAAFKLLEIQEKDQLIKPGMCIVDLGAAPGGWSQVAANILDGNGRVIALDILEMPPMAGVEVIQGDFREQSVLDALLALIGDDHVDLIISDMAPNTSGQKSVDQPRAMYLVELAVELAERVLKPNGHLLMKVFQGAGFDTFLAALRPQFKKVMTRKPKASRARSKEAYLLAKGYNL